MRQVREYDSKPVDRPTQVYYSLREIEHTLNRCPPSTEGTVNTLKESAYELIREYLLIPREKRTRLSFDVLSLKSRLDSLRPERFSF